MFKFYFRSLNHKLIDESIDNCMEAAHEAYPDILPDKSDEAVRAWWRRKFEKIQDEENYLYLEFSFNDEPIGCLYCEKISDDVIDMIGGFWKNVYGSKTFVFKPDWWTAVTDFAKSEGYKEIWSKPAVGTASFKMFEYNKNFLEYETKLVVHDNEPFAEYVIYLTKNKV